MSKPAIKRLVGPTALSTTLTTNIFNQSSSLIETYIRHIHVANTGASVLTFSLWLGATGANTSGTELFKGYSVAANSTFDWYPVLKLLSTDFLVGGASGSGLVITIAGEQYAV